MFTKNQERDSAQHILLLLNLLYGVRPTHLRKLPYQYAEDNSIKHAFNKDVKMAGYDCFSGLMTRNPSLSIRKPETTSVHRISAFNKGSWTFFDNPKAVISKHNFPPNRIYNINDKFV